MEYLSKTLEIENKKVELFCPKIDAADTANANEENKGRKRIPLVILNADEDEGSRLWQAAKEEQSFALAVVSSLDWNHDMSPWEQQPVFRNGEAFTGGADVYLKLLENKILPAVKQEGAAMLGEAAEISAVVLAGYSLAGLFALYAGYRSDDFDGIVSASGSFWFPGILDFVKDNTISNAVDAVYFSLGDREALTKNEVMATVEENTWWIRKQLEKQGVTTVFETNPGNHFQDDDIRLLKGIRWIVTRVNVREH